MTMEPDDHDIRRATALVHAVPRAAMRVVMPCGATMRVGRHPAADVGPCEFRRFMVEARDPELCTVRARIRVQAVEGVLSPLGGGVFADRSDAAVRWLTTGLCGRATAELLSDHSSELLDGLPEDAVSATIRVDPTIGVSVLGLRVEEPSLRDRLDDLALAVLAQQMVAELAADLVPALDREV